MFDDFDIGPQSDEAFDPYDIEYENDFTDTDEPFDRDGWDDQAALDSVYGPEDDSFDSGDYGFDGDY